MSPSKGIIQIQARKNDSVKLSAAGSTDPDGDQLFYEWFIYREASGEGIKATLSDKSDKEIILTIDPDSSAGDLHLIVRVSDDGSPSLVSYRRAIVHVTE